MQHKAVLEHRGKWSALLACRGSRLSRTHKLPPQALLPSTTGDQPLTRNAGKLANHFCRISRRRRLDNGQVEAVVAVLGQLCAGFEELNEERTRLALATGEAIEVAQ